MAGAFFVVKVLRRTTWPFGTKSSYVAISLQRSDSFDVNRRFLLSFVVCTVLCIVALADRSCYYYLQYPFGLHNFKWKVHHCLVSPSVASFAGKSGSRDRFVSDLYAYLLAACVGFGSFGHSVVESIWSLASCPSVCLRRWWYLSCGISSTFGSLFLYVPMEGLSSDACHKPGGCRSRSVWTIMCPIMRIEKLDFDNGTKVWGQCKVCKRYGHLGDKCVRCVGLECFYLEYDDPVALLDPDEQDGSHEEAALNPLFVGSLAYFMCVVAEYMGDLGSSYEDSWYAKAARALVRCHCYSIESLMFNLMTINDALDCVPNKLPDLPFRFTSDQLNSIQRVGTAWLNGDQGYLLRTLDHGMYARFVFRAYPFRIIPRLCLEEQYVKQEEAKALSIFDTCSVETAKYGMSSDSDGEMWL